jgi:hypothetical protein
MWSGREDSNLRPLGPEPNVYTPISEGFLRSPHAGSIGVVIRQRPDPAFADHGGRVSRAWQLADSAPASASWKYGQARVKVGDLSSTKRPI